MIRSLFQQRLESLKRNWTLQFSTLLVVTACYLVVCSSLLMSQNLRKVLTVWGEELQMTVYLSENTETQDVESLQKKIEANPNVGKIKFISKEIALEDFRAQMASYAPDILNEKDLLNLIPASFQVSLSESLRAVDHLKVLDVLASTLKSEKSVAEVSYGQEWVQKYGQFIYYFEKGCQALGVIIFCAALFVLSNVIRASIHSRRQEIEVLELIGATPAMIRRPFMIEGALIGFVSSALAVTISYFAYSNIVGLFQNELRFLQLGQHLSFLGVGLVVFFCLAGTLLGALGSYLCVRQINDGWAARSL
ncbi:cell division protein FtsX [Bdellovibrio sp. HCB337]|uniref:cell division protein FtsX n=1 Tax=Bdellovibrio sp. HCB337 TaxID=3394358 RepID=UPI0039A72684